jgi:hypothetical protein
MTEVNFKVNKEPLLVDPLIVLSEISPVKVFNEGFSLFANL